MFAVLSLKNIEQLGEVMLAAVALLLPIVAVALFLIN